VSDVCEPEGLGGDVRVNVSSVKQFMQCRFRWWAQFVMNRVPLVTPAALDGGKILHRAFERFEKGTASLADSLAAECSEFRAQIPHEHPSCGPTLVKAVTTFEDVIEAMHLWEDKFDFDEVFEVEQAHEWQDPELEDVTWLLRPDKVVRADNLVWHVQRRGLAASKNFATYVRLQNRSYHEHLYATVLAEKYCGTDEYTYTSGNGNKHHLKYAGTIFDLLRKLKFRTNVGKKNEQVKTAEEMFYQQPMWVNLRTPLHASVMMSLRQHVVEMQRCITLWRTEGLIPAPNEDQNGGYSGNSEDPYFRVLMGEVKLSDNTIFKDREDQYAEASEGDG
jgi:hypothetical protein